MRTLRRLFLVWLASHDDLPLAAGLDQNQGDPSSRHHRAYLV
jgi:hypothetical protein